MARDRLNATDMVRAMGAGMRVLELLIKEAALQGANPEALAFLTRPRFKDNLERIGKAIAECDWRIPASEMRQLARKAAKRDFAELTDGEIEQAANLWWGRPCEDFGIHFDSYCQDPDHGSPAIPPGVLTELHGQTMRYPLIIGKNPDFKQVVVLWETKDNSLVRPGDCIDANNIDMLSLAYTKYFDFDK